MAKLNWFGTGAKQARYGTGAKSLAPELKVERCQTRLAPTAARQKMPNIGIIGAKAV